MRLHFRVLLCLLAVFPGRLWPYAATPAKGADALGRANPRSAVTAFLESCQDHDYTRAAQYLDLRQLPERLRAAEGPKLAKQLEAILNSDSQFSVLRLSQAAGGDLADDGGPQLAHISTIARNASTFTIDLERVSLDAGSEVWLFSPATVAAVPSLAPVISPSFFEERLPHFLISITLLETPLWKWIALAALALLIGFLLRLTGRSMDFLTGRFAPKQATSGRWMWVESLIEPWLVFLSAMAFGLGEQFIDPSALTRLYIARAILLVVVWAFSWCVINLVDLSLLRIDSLLDPRQRVVSHSLIYLGRRTAKFAIVVVAMIIVLDNWGYDMTTMIAGLGVGGIAIALAAQSTIANVFGGVSVIGDRPVMLGDFGNFGGIIGTVEDIGMRSTRVRTLNRTIMSIPNSSFAGMNLENYEARDKILFNPTLQIKRGTPKDKIRQLMKSVEDLLRNNKRLEAGPTPIRLSSLTAASFALEIFVYALTADINEFYKIEADLFIEIDDALSAGGVELA
jgi:MscS family membrane protein